MDSKEFRLALVALNTCLVFVVRIAEVFLAAPFLSRQQFMMRYGMMSSARRRAHLRCLPAFCRRVAAPVN